MTDFGHAPKPKIICASCGRDIDASGDHVASWKDEWDAREAARKTAQAASLRPYSGSIAQCQAGVVTSDRIAHYYRCDKRPKHIREVQGEGPMAVCGVHAKASGCSRYRGETNKWRGGPTPPADEEVVG